MKILHIAETTWGGCGTYLNEILPLQVQSFGIDNVRCLVPRQHASHLGDVPAEVIWRFERLTRVSGLPRLAASTWSAIKRWQPDVIHAHSTFAGAVVRVLSYAWPIAPIVYCPHGWSFEVEQPRWRQAVARTAEKLLSRQALCIVAISDAERLQGVDAGIDKRKLVSVPNGIDSRCPEPRAAWDDSRLKVLFVGRLDRQKGVDVLLSALENLDASVCARIVGEHVLVQKKSLPPSADSHVEFLGWCNKASVAAQINACDLVVMPSRWEGFGLVAIEAMRASKPVIASSVGGLTEIVVNGVTGLLVPPDDPRALAIALTRCDRAMLRRMGVAGRQRFVERFTRDRTHACLSKIYVDAISAHQAATAASLGPHTHNVVVK